MQYFCAFFVTKRGMFLISILILLLYGFPSCCDDDNVTNTDDNAQNCNYEFEVDGIIYQEHHDDYHLWVLQGEHESYVSEWLLTHSTLPLWNLPKLYQQDSLHVRIIGVEIPEPIDQAVDIRPWPLLILSIEKTEQ